jgi:predicted MFS family arabinose efflux permease
LYPVRIRGGVLAWFYSAIPVGSALGFALGGQVGSALGWRWPFYLVVPPGVLLGLWCFFMREPKRGQADAGAEAAERPAGIKEYLEFFRIPSFTFNTFGMTAMTFAFGGLAFWMPTYLEEVDAPNWGPIDRNTIFGGLTALAGLTATLIGGIVGDRLRPRFPGSYFLVSGATMLIGFPMVLLFIFLNNQFPLNWFVIFVTVFCLFFNTGPTNTILANVTHPAVRARAFALNILMIHILGDVISPYIIGLIRDFTGSLVGGFVLVSVMILVGGVLWLWGTRYLEEDTRLAPTRLFVEKAAQ